MHNVIEGKRVCFVGSCPNIIDKGLAKKINSYDVVIRTNGSINLILNDPEYIKHYGKKCNVAYYNSQYTRDGWPFDTKGMKKLGITHCNFKNIHPDKEKELLKKGFNVRSLSALVKYMHTILPSPLMGSILIKDVLSFNPKEFYITGIDFFESKPNVFIPDDYREYYPGYLTKKTEMWANINVPKKNNGKDGHDKKSNTAFIYNLIDEGLVTTDDFIIESALTILRR